MTHEIYSYRFAEEIIRYSKYSRALKEIVTIIKECPLFIYPNKSSNNPKLDIVQQVLNTYFDRRFACDAKWQYHPPATSIPGSKLTADFRKDFTGLRIQAEVQFGNMARWYSDIFKFQTAYSQDLIDIGLSIVPKSAIAKRMDSNIANFERCKREIPSAKLSITLPILLIGVEPDKKTQTVDVSKTGFKNLKAITGKHQVPNRYRIVTAFLNKKSIEDINAHSDIGPYASLKDDDGDESG
jgi:hypothetical protein